jgi:hypothetical protein
LDIALDVGIAKRREREPFWSDRNQLAPAALGNQPAAHFPVLGRTGMRKAPDDDSGLFRYQPPALGFRPSLHWAISRRRAGGRRRRVHSNHRDSNNLVFLLGKILPLGYRHFDLHIARNFFERDRALIFTL